MSMLRRSITGFLVLVLLGVALPFVVQPATATAQADAVVINEFQAVNESTLADNTGAFEDWIELHNTSGSTVDLGGWVIADGSADFVFSSGTTIPGGGYRVIWASDDISRTTAQQIHLPFKLSSSGESLTLTSPNGNVSTPAWIAPDIFPGQIADDSYGISSGGEIRYFTAPTPGSENRAGREGIAESVTFSVDHGFFSSAQNVVLSSSTPGTTIRYTTNGELPSESVGTAIAPGSSIRVSSTSVIRAVAFRDGWITSPVETRSYLFTNDIVAQRGRPDGWPSSPLAGRGQVLDYGMDPNVVNGNEAAIRSSLTAIPSISIVTDLDNLFDPGTGIYANADRRGAEWERQASVELIDPSRAEPGFDIEAGIRIRGGASRRQVNPKHAFRFYFRDEYEGELNYPLFGDEGDDRFELVDLRTASNYAWSWRHADDASFIDELWSRDTQAAMGQPYTRSRQYHVYINGIYWGLHMTQERVSGEYGETYFGGDEDDYDVVKRNSPDADTEASDGTDAAWKTLFPLVSDLNITDAEYRQIDSQVDIVNLADFYLLHFWTGDFDSSPSWFFRNADGERWGRSNNWFALRNRNGVGEAAKWQFFDHDSEHALCANNGPRDGADIDNTTPWSLQPLVDGEQFLAPSYLHAALITHPTYRQIFSDRVTLHMLTPGGALTIPEAQSRLDFRSQEVSPAVEAESARWGDGGGEPAFGRAEWENGVARLSNCFAQREVIVEQQLREDGLWPTSDPPAISPAAGPIDFGATISISAAGQSGTIYYTVDGSDPRAADGSIAGSAQTYAGPISAGSDLTVRARILDGNNWTPIAEASYVLATAAGPVRLALNEFNAVSGSRFLGDGTAGDIANGSDETFGRIAGNGGDWFELVVIEDDLDIRGWTFEVWNEEVGLLTLDASFTLSNSPALDGFRAGTLITVSEDIADDLSYDPVHDDWHINLQANAAGAGDLITAASQSSFAINNNNTQIAIFDATGAPVQLRTGEGTVPDVSVNSSEVFKLEATPTTSLGPDSEYADGTSSTWGLPNSWSGGAIQQDLSGLRISFGDVNCDGRLDLSDALVLAQFSVGGRVDTGPCPVPDGATDIHGAAGDVNDDGRIDLGDALLVAQCAVGVTNDFCR